MKLPRAAARSISRLLIGVLLFAQFAIASYACPMLFGPLAAASATAVADASAAAAMAGCDEMQPERTNLCVEHCRQGQQSADTTAAPLVGGAIQTVLYPIAPAALASGSSRPTGPARLAALATAPPPSHAILHCVFRI